VQLYLDNNKIGATGAVALADAIASDRALTVVCWRLPACKICRRAGQVRLGEEGGQRVRRPRTHFSAQLYISYNAIGDAGAGALAAAVVSNDALTKVCCASLQMLLLGLILGACCAACSCSDRARSCSRAAVGVQDWHKPHGTGSARQRTERPQHKLVLIICRGFLNERPKAPAFMATRSSPTWEPQWRVMRCGSGVTATWDRCREESCWGTRAPL